VNNLLIQPKLRNRPPRQLLLHPPQGPGQLNQQKSQQTKQSSHLPFHPKLLPIQPNSPLHRLKLHKNLQNYQQKSQAPVQNQLPDPLKFQRQNNRKQPERRQLSQQPKNQQLKSQPLQSQVPKSQAPKSQPLKSLYLLLAIPIILFIRLPYWVFVSAVPALRPRKTWSMKRTLLLYVIDATNSMTYQTGFGAPPSNPEKDSANSETTGFAWVDAIPENLVTGELGELARRNQVTPARVFGYWYGARDEQGKPGQHAAKGERVLYYIHGGGHVTGSSHPSSMWGAILNGFLEKCAPVGKRAFALEFRLASSAPYKPENPFPTSIIDALSGYRYLVETLGFEPLNIIVSGDSSGGHVANNFVRYLVNAALPNLAAPGALILLSPTMDWANTHLGTPASTMDVNGGTDFVRPVLLNGYSATSMRGSLDVSELETNSWLSPSSLKLESTEGLFTNYPPTAILAGGAEQTVDAMRTFRDRLVHDSGRDKVLYLEYPDAFHDWLMVPAIEPERSQAFSELEKWLEEIYSA